MNTKTLDTILTVIAAIISVAGLAICIAIMMGYESWIDLAINLTFGLLIVAGGAAIIFAIIQLATNIKRNMSMLAGIIVFIVLGFVCYAIADDTVLRSYEGVTAETSQLSGAGLYLMYILLLGAVLAAIIGEATRIFK